jgi:hypothetical protein
MGCNEAMLKKEMFSNLQQNPRAQNTRQSPQEGDRSARNLAVVLENLQNRQKNPYLFQ